MEEKKRRRTTQQVKDDIINAVGNVIEKQGISKLGVESVAAEAGMDKAMLYRHYKDFNDILKNYIEQEDFWVNILNKQTGVLATDDLIHHISQLIESQFAEILKNVKLQELIKWELVDKNHLMKDISQKRENLAKDLLAMVESSFPYKNISSNSLLAIITAGVYYLVIHKDISTFCGVDLNKNNHKKAFLSDLKWLIQRIFAPLSEVEQIVLNCIDKGFDNELINEITNVDIEWINKLRNQK